MRLGRALGASLLVLLAGLVALGAQLNVPLGQTGTLIAAAATPSAQPLATATAVAQGSATPAPTTQSTPTATATVQQTAGPSPTATAAPTATASPAPTVVLSSDGHAQLSIPFGALDSATTVTVTALNEADLPPELKGVVVRASFYRIEPLATTLSVAAIFDRTVDPTSVGFALDDQKAPIITLARRDADGHWSFVDTQAESMHADGLINVAGELTAFGDVYGFGTTSIFVQQNTADQLAVAAGGQAQIKLSLNYPSTLATANRPRIADQPSVAADAAQLVQLDTPVVGKQRSSGQNLTLNVTCLASGTTTIATTFQIDNVGAGQALYDTLGLTITSATFTVETEVTCG